MEKFIIQGGVPLMGAVRVGGAKNAGFKQMVAAVLADTKSRILNLSSISDVEVTGMVLRKMGINVSQCGERSFCLDPNKIKTFKVPQFSGKKTRGSTIFAGMLLSKIGKAVIPLPGGCVLGARPIDRHLQAFKSLGVKLKFAGKYIYLSAKKLRGAKFKFPKKTHTGTEAMLLASVKATGKTVIENAALEPEIDDLILFLTKMGAKIKRAYPDKIIIQGVKHLKGAVHQVMPDRNEAVSYAVAGLATKGDIVLENARQEDLKVFLEKLDEIGACFEISHFGIRFWYEEQLKATDIKTSPAPGFMTDWQPLWTILMTQVRGISNIVERVHNNRFQFVEQLNRMGAKITLYNPKVADPRRFYEFDQEENDPSFHAAKVIGPTPLKGAKLTITDLRAGATLVIAALVTKGRSVLTNIEHIDRGYENLDGKLRQLGARIKRVKA
ncbi:MAG TPA: UDP-N-acetylglucosamine 1-carboxyvinyltransferase [Candidatus Bathyarchaeia archaeon]|nr:UDP-N-acetylglucosamine 1-carboxyvinyltransferase [Candidatus Bathyarchaeia archaeon]